MNFFYLIPLKIKPKLIHYKITLKIFKILYLPLNIYIFLLWAVFSITLLCSQTNKFLNFTFSIRKQWNQNFQSHHHHNLNVWEYSPFYKANSIRVLAKAKKKKSRIIIS